LSSLPAHPVPLAAFLQLMEQRSLLEEKDELVAKTKDKLARSAKMQVCRIDEGVTVAMVTPLQGQYSALSVWFQTKTVPNR